MAALIQRFAAPGGVRRLGALLLCLATLVASAGAWAQEDSATLERRVKAAFLFKFPSFVEWPEGTFPRSDTPLTVGVLGDDAMAGELAQLGINRTVEGRPLAVKKLRPGDSIAGLHILFVAREESARIPQLARIAQSQATLVVTESDGALQQGSIINFVLSSGRVRFEIALEGAEKRGFRLSSRLLAVAQNVRSGSTQ